MMRALKLILLIVVLVALDQLIKAYLISRSSNSDYITVYQNVGVSLALLPALPWRSILPFVLFVLMGFLLKQKSYGLSLIIAGGVSNLIDRFYRGGVVDFIDLKILPVFNLADMIISVGSIILLIEIIKQELRDESSGPV